MSSCDIDPPLAFQAGGPCGGNGVCVNSTLTPERLLCLCNSGYSGASDFFDTRVEQLPNGEWLSLGCGNSDIGTKVMWSFYLLFGLIRIKQLIAPLRVAFRSHMNDKKKKRLGFYADFPLRILAWDMFICTPLFFIVGIGKMCGMTLGTDGLVTIPLGLSVVFVSFSIYAILAREFSAFVNGTTSPAEAKRIQTFRSIIKILSIAYYFGLVVVPSWWTLSLDKRLGPIENREEIAIYLRNIGSVTYGMVEMVTTYMVYWRVNQFRSIAPTDALLFIIERLKADMKYYVVYLSTIGVIYTIATVPYFFQFQTYTISFIVALGAMRHGGKSLYGSAKSSSQKGASNGKSNNNNKSDKTKSGGGGGKDTRPENETNDKNQSVTSSPLVPSVAAG